MPDKRQHSRLHSVHLVSYTKYTPDNLTELMGLGNTIDLSEGGLRLTLKEPLNEGDVLQLDFTVEGKVIKTDAAVVHVEEVKHYNIGFRFGEGLDADEQEKIRQYLKKHAFKNESKDAL
jgi:hypothetical protein